MKPQIVDPSIKESVKNDIEHLYLKGLITMNSLSKTHSISLQKLAQLRDEVIEEIRDRHKMMNKTYILAQREVMLGELGRGDCFIPKEYEGTKFAHQLYTVIEINGKNVLVKNPLGKEESFTHELRVIIKVNSMEQDLSSQ